MPRTIIDLLKRGNQELFYSAMLAWLLDPTEKHALGNQFLQGFIQKANERGISVPKTGWDQVEVRTEATGRGSRYDILVEGSGGGSFVIENKTKSVGGSGQVDRYRKQGWTVVPLGFVTASYHGVGPVLTYRDIGDLLEDTGYVRDDAFGHLIRHFRAHLDYELGHVGYVEGIASGEVDEFLRTRVRQDRQSGDMGENDVRFLNLLLLYLIQRDLREGVLRDTRPHWNKNMASGSWLAWREPEEGYEWAEPVEAAVAPGRVWFHLELHSGVLVAGLDESAGHIQLRAKSAEDQGNRELYEALHSATEDEPVDWARRPAATYKSFKIASIPVSGVDLSSEKLSTKIHEFMGTFGSFG